MVVPKRAFFFTFLCRTFSSSTTTRTTKLPKLRCINKIPPIYKSRAIDEAQKALIEYLHTTKSLPFAFAEQIANNSPFSLSNLLRKVHFSAPKFYKSFQNLLRYEPINEFEFFLESIGIDYDDVSRYLPPRKFFFSEDWTVLGAACALSQFGFPWNRLGKLYEEEALIFRKSSCVLTNRLHLLKERYRSDNLCVVGICLAYPRLLSSEGDLGGDSDAMICDLKRVFLEIDEGLCVEGNVDAWYELCCKVRTFHDLGCEKGKVGELICAKKEAFFRCPKRVLVEKAEYFRRFDARKEDVGSWLLQSPEILSLDLETPVISVSGLLEHVGLDANELQCVKKKYPYVFGRNKLANLPHVAKALDLHEWCFDKIKSSNGQLLATYAIGSPAKEDKCKEFIDALKEKKSPRYIRGTMCKLDFLKSIGFGENILTMKILKRLGGTGTELQRRFDYLLSLGIKHSNLMLMIRSSRNILCLNPENIEVKTKFLYQEMGSLEYLNEFPDLLCYEFENRIKRRYQFCVWLRETGLCTKKYSIASMVMANEKQFIARLFRIHRAAPKRVAKGLKVILAVQKRSS